MEARVLLLVCKPPLPRSVVSGNPRLSKQALPGKTGIGSLHRIDRAYSVGVIPNFSLNCREKWCTVEYCSTWAISVKFIFPSRIISLLSWSLARRMYSPGEICRFL